MQKNGTTVRPVCRTRSGVARHVRVQRPATAALGRTGVVYHVPDEHGHAGDALPLRRSRFSEVVVCNLHALQLVSEAARVRANGICKRR